MVNIYKECKDCVAKPFCKKYINKTFPDNAFYSWCSEHSRLKKALKLSKLPLEYISSNIYNYKIDTQNQKAYDKILPLVNNITESVESGISVIIVGADCGTGKTYNASVLLNQYIYKNCLTEKFDYETPLALFIDYAEFMSELRNFESNEDAQNIFEDMKTVPLLLLDDVGAGIMSRFTREQTYLILNHRYNNKLATIVTSNIEAQKLADEEVLGKRNMSRLMRNYVYVSLQGNDRRKSKFKGEVT